MADDTKLCSYDFELPAENIAQQPSSRRDHSRLMFIDEQKKTSHHKFCDLAGLLREGDLIIRNNTKVIPARLLGKRSGGGKTEALLMHPAARHPGEEQLPGVRWVCLAKPTSHLKPGKIIDFADGQLTGTVEKRLGGGKVIFSFTANDEAEFMQLVDKIGELPLPPYIDRKEEGISDNDRTRYQTTFAAKSGAVAAPTAGLHFTPELDQQLSDKGINIAEITLHVGPGTFRPIIADDITEHKMDGEFYEVSEKTAELINNTRANGGRIIAVGTTSTRTLETITDENGITSPRSGWADLFIKPGYRWKAIDGLITNFHLPQSSLIVLVSALIGRERILAAYKEAIENGYRFYSYGDAMLIIP